MAEQRIPLSDCFPQLLQAHGEEAGIHLNAYVRRSSAGVLSNDEASQVVRKQTLKFRVQQFAIFHDLLFKSSSDSAAAPWLPQYMHKQFPIDSALNRDECVKYLKPLLFPFAAVVKLDRMVEVTRLFAKFSLTRAEYLLEHHDEMRATLQELNDNLLLESMMSQERHPEAVTRRSNLAGLQVIPE